MLQPMQASQPTDAAHWAEETAEFDFSADDNLKNPGEFNRIIWKGLKRD